MKNIRVLLTVGLIAVGTLGAHFAQAQEVGGGFRRADQAYGRQDFSWPKIDGKAIIAYWPSDRNNYDMNVVEGPNAEKFCRSLGFEGQSGYLVYDNYSSGEWDVGLNDDRGARTNYYMAAQYDYYRGNIPFGVFQAISCSGGNDGGRGDPGRGGPGRGDDGRGDGGRGDDGRGRHR